MSGAKRFFKNAILMSAAALFMRTVSVGYNVYVTNIVGAEGIGLFTLVMTAYSFAVTFATSGISLAVTRMTTETVLTAPPGEEQKRLSNVMVTSVLYCLFFGILGGAVLFFGAEYIGCELLGDDRTVLSLKILALTLAPTSLSSALSGYFNACRRVFKNAAVSVVGQLVKIALTAFGLSLLLPKGAEYALAALVGGGAISEAGTFLLSWALYVYDRHSHFGARAKKRGARCSSGDIKGTELSAGTKTDAAASILSSALPVAISSYVRSGFLTLEHILIPRGLEKWGQSYSAALASYGTLQGMVMPVIMFPYAILGSFTSLLVPEISESRARGEVTRIKYITRRVFRTTLLFAVCTSALMICFSNELGVILYDSEEAGYYIRVLAPVIPVMYLDTATDSLLKGLGEQLFCMRVNIFDSALSVVLVWLLVPVWGVVGYAAVIIVCEVINASLSIWRLLSVTGVRPKILGWLVVPALTAAASCLIVSALSVIAAKSLGIGGTAAVGTAAFAILSALLAAALYFALLAVSGNLTREETGYAKMIFSRGRKGAG
ncbi:MAG: oligosaccharide flippase family protein [Clostridia bacterium]|nr:oligosaccharide flippase family protein [Clostridia bacterium]